MRAASALAVLVALGLAGCAPRPASDLETGGPLVVQTETDLVRALGGYGYILRGRALSTPREFPTIDASEFTVELGPDGERSAEFFQVYTFASDAEAEDAAGRAQRRNATVSRRTVLHTGRIVVVSYTPRLRSSRLRGDLRQLLVAGTVGSP